MLCSIISEIYVQEIPEYVCCKYFGMCCLFLAVILMSMLLVYEPTGNGLKCLFTRFTNNWDIVFITDIRW